MERGVLILHGSSFVVSLARVGGTGALVDTILIV